MGNCGGKDDDQFELDEQRDFDKGNVCYITDNGSWDKKTLEANEAGKVVLANFSASWCEPCKTMARTFAELSVKHPSLVFLTVDVDELADLSTSLDVRATPTIFFLKDGQQLDKIVGASKVCLLQKLEKYGNSQR